MPIPDESGHQIEQILTAAFLAECEGKEIDLNELCGMDVELLARVEHLLEKSRAVGDLASELLGPEIRTVEQLTVLGDFKILKLLGAGGMGRVFLAREGSLDRLVALKVIRKELHETGALTTRFKREAELTASLDHPAIVPIFAVGETETHCFIAMKWLSGPSLHEMPKPIDPYRVAEIGMQLASALEVAHASGVIHRDVKPANVLLDDNQPVLVDFGLARSHSSPDLTSAGAIPGTLAYLAPEKLGPQRRSLDPRSDLYSLGATLFELLSGDPPFKDEDPDRLLRSILLQDPRIPREHAPPPDLETIVLRCLAKEPERRFETAQCLADDLARFIQGTEIVSKPISRVSRIVRKIVRYPRTFSALALLSLATAFVCALLINSITARHQTRERRLEDVRLAISEMHLREAKNHLKALSTEWPANPKVQAQVQALERAEAFEALLDLVQDRAASNESSRVHALIRKVHETRSDEEDSASLLCTLALAALVRNDHPSAKAYLAEAAALPEAAESERFDLQVLGAVAEDRLPKSIDVPDSASIDQVLNVVHVLRHKGGDRRVIKRLLDHTLKPEANHLRARVALGIHHAEQGNHELALTVFQSLPTDGSCRNLIRRNRARLYFLLGHAQLSLDEIALIRPEERISHTVLLEVNALERIGDDKTARERLSEAVDRWPNDSEVKLKQASRHLAKDRLSAAWALYDAVAESSGYKPTQDSAMISRLTVEIAQSVATLDVTQRVRLDADQRRDLGRMGRRLAALIKSSQSHRVKAQAHGTLAWIHFLHGNCAQSLASYMRASALHPGVATYPVNALATFITWDQAQPNSTELKDQRQTMVALATTLSHPRGVGELPLSRTQRANASLFLADDAYRKKDWAGCQRHATEAVEALGHEHHPSIKETAKSYIRFSTGRSAAPMKLTGR